MKRNWVEAEWENTLHRVQRVPGSEGGLGGGAEEAGTVQGLEVRVRMSNHILKAMGGQLRV